MFIPIQKLISRTFLLLAVLLATTHVSVSADLKKALSAYNEGDFAAAFAQWKPLAEQGNASAQFYLGNLYHSGKGIPADQKIAVQWYQKAAQQGHTDAQVNLGNAYAYGKGVKSDSVRAVKWYRESAQQGHPKGQLLLGLMHEMGNGVPKDKIKAHMWFDISAAGGQAHAAKLRDTVAKGMTPSEIKSAQGLKRECMARSFIGCENDKIWLLLMSFYVAPPTSVDWDGPWKYGIFRTAEHEFTSKNTCLPTEPLKSIT